MSVMACLKNGNSYYTFPDAVTTAKFKPSFFSGHRREYYKRRFSY